MSDEPLARRPEETRLGTLVRLLLWDFERGSLAYDIAFFLVMLALLLIPQGLWQDPLVPGR